MRGPFTGLSCTGNFLAARDCRNILTALAVRTHCSPEPRGASGFSGGKTRSFTERPLPAAVVHPPAALPLETHE